MVSRAITAATAIVPTLSRELRASSPRILPARKRASVAIIVRVVDVDTDNYDVIGSGGNAPAVFQQEFLSSNRAMASTADNTEILFMKRTSRPGDPWSGNVAFPGGHRAADDVDDVAAAVRETREEVGLRLDDASVFMYLGRLDDRAVYERGRRRGDFALCPFVFVQMTAITPPLVLQPSEVAAARWVPISELTPEAVDAFAVETPFRLLPPVVPSTVSAVLGLSTAHYPSILLRPPQRSPVEEHLRQSVKGGSLTAVAAQQLSARVASELATSAPSLPTFQSNDDPSHKFQLWGLTLAATSDLLALLGRPRLNWPPLRFRGVLADCSVAAICGFIEVLGYLRGTRPLAALSPRHVGWAVGAAAVPIAVVAWVASR